MHPDEQKWIKDNAKAFAQRLNGGQAPSDVQVADAEQRLAQQGFRQVQHGVGNAWDQAASSFLSQARMMLPADPSCAACGISYSFQPTAAQKADAWMYANYLPQDRINNFYAQNALSLPASAAVDTADQGVQGTPNILPGNTSVTTGTVGGSWPPFLPGKESK
ncbi:hypothetical protein AB4156_32505 [Cupriavidus sp. 2MCAB6]|uniref:hypothetical protein n=1 Tax=Cupriavidus sp. 2MCAB6 TaxID=3232981 RepID=UPI003F905086